MLSTLTFAFECKLCQHLAMNKSSYHHGDLANALVAAALKVVEQDGEAGVSLRDLAQSLGVSRAAPYRHFADRDALLAAVAVEGFRAFNKMLADSVAGPSEPSALSRMAQAYVAFGRRQSGLYRLLFASPATASALEDSELYSIGQASFGLLLAVLGPATDPHSVERHAVKIWAALHGVVMLADQGLLARANLKDLVDDIVA